ncbi:Hypothetical predicted protein [Octopus vulgaris]|uniref:Uncharacterized protein n=1 Tax=Octopus vulgaris TaxID=6645 RepID=A0AA36F3A2_OCTVU|nr:Hypothetical predicted protein [Octopus vulgaris]
MFGLFAPVFPAETISGYFAPRTKTMFVIACNCILFVFHRFPFPTTCKARPIRKVSIEIPDCELYSEIVDRKKISMKTPVNSSKSISIINDNQKHYNTNLAFVGDNSEDYFSDFQADIDDFYIVLEKDSTLFPSTKDLKLELMHDIMLDDVSLKGAGANEHFDEDSPKNQNNAMV